MNGQRLTSPTRFIRFFVFCTLVILTSQLTIIPSWSKDGPINVMGKDLSSLFRFKKGMKYIPLEEGCSVLGMKAIADGDKWVIKGTYKGDIKATARKNGFIERDKIIFAPVDFWQKELGLEVCEKNDIVYVVNRIVEVKKTSDGLLITTAAPISIKSFTLDNPSRTVYDVNNLAIGSEKPEIGYSFDGLPFSSIRIGQFSKFNHVGRFVVDRSSNASFQPIQSLHGPSNNILWIGQTKYQEPLSTSQASADTPENSEIRVSVESDGSVLLSGVKYDKAKLNYLWYEKPLRVVCDLENCVLANGKEQEFPGRGDIIRVRLAQNSESMVRLVIEVSKPLTMQISESTDNTIRISPVAQNFRTGFKVLIDAGHGNADYGCQIKNMAGLSANEKDLNLKLALMLGKILESRGVQVFYTRQDDSFLDLVARREMASRLGVNLLVSIHCNATPHRPQYFVSGPEIYYFSPRDKTVAEAVWRHMSQLMGIRGRGYLFGRMAVLMNEKISSILVETCYLNNPNDLARILNNSNGFCDVAMSGVADGIAEVYGLPMSSQKQSPAMLSTEARKAYTKTEEQVGRKIGMLSLDYNPFEQPSRNSNNNQNLDRENSGKETTETPQIFEPPDKKKKSIDEIILLEDIVGEAVDTKSTPDNDATDTLKNLLDKQDEVILISEKVESEESDADKEKKMTEEEIKKKKNNIFKLE